MPDYIRIEKKKKKVKLMICTSAWVSGKPSPGFFDKFSGVDYYRMVLPYKELDKMSDKYECHVVGELLDTKNPGITAQELWEKIYLRSEFDGTVVKNLHTQNVVAQVLAGRDTWKKKVIVDLDDNVNLVDKESPVYEVFNPGSLDSKVWAVMRENCDAMFVENDRLANYYSEKKSFVLPNCIDETWNYPVVKKNDGFIRVGYAGGVTHKRDMRSIQIELNYILGKYPKVKLVMLCNDDFGFPADRIEKHNGTNDFREYLPALQKTGIDIGIIPLANFPFNEYKSFCKYMEYSCCGIVTLAQGNKNMPYARVISENINGMLFKTPKQFCEKLEFLINNESQRNFMVENAKKTIQDFTIQKNWKKWEQALDEVFV